MSEWNEDSAVISRCGHYRYILTRALAGMGPPLVMCLLNPSDADAYKNDPTVRRGIGFANREGACSLVFVNLYAWRCTKPSDMPRADDPFDDPVGPENDSTLLYVAQRAGGRIVCAWGANAERERVLAVCGLFREAQITMLCLGTTKHGHPRHPLYVRGDQPLMPFKGDLV